MCINICMIVESHDVHNYFYLVPCSTLISPNNGMINCSLGDDGVPFHKDTCSFTCNTGYELTGSDTRTCQSNGSWSGSNTMCTKGRLLHKNCFMVHKFSYN